MAVVSFEVTVYFVMWCLSFLSNCVFRHVVVSFEGHQQARTKGCDLQRAVFMRKYFGNCITE